MLSQIKTKNKKVKGGIHYKYMNVKFIAKSNYLLRKVLNSNNNLDILQDLIESILNIKIEKIILNPYLKQNNIIYRNYCRSYFF